MPLRSFRHRPANEPEDALGRPRLLTVPELFSAILRWRPLSLVADAARVGLLLIAWMIVVAVSAFVTFVVLMAALFTPGLSLIGYHYADANTGMTIRLAGTIIVGVLTLLPGAAVLLYLLGFWPVLLVARRYAPGVSPDAPMKLFAAMARHLPTFRAVYSMLLVMLLVVASGIAMIVVGLTLVHEAGNPGASLVSPASVRAGGWLILCLSVMPLVVGCRFCIWPLVLLDAPTQWGLRAGLHTERAVSIGQAIRVACVALVLMLPSMALVVIGTIDVLRLSRQPWPGTTEWIVLTRFVPAGVLLLLAMVLMLPVCNLVYRRVRGRLPWLITIGQPTRLIDRDGDDASTPTPAGTVDQATSAAVQAGPGFDADDTRSVRQLRSRTRLMRHMIRVPAALLVLFAAIGAAIWWWPAGPIDDAWYAHERAQPGTVAPSHGTPGDTAWRAFQHRLNELPMPPGYWSNPPPTPSTSPGPARFFPRYSPAGVVDAARRSGVRLLVRDRAALGYVMWWPLYSNAAYDARLVDYVDHRMQASIGVAHHGELLDALDELRWAVDGLTGTGGEAAWLQGAAGMMRALQYVEMVFLTRITTVDDLNRVDDALSRLDAALAPSIAATVRSWVDLRSRSRNALPNHAPPFTEVCPQRSLAIAPRMIERLREIDQLPDGQAFLDAVRAFCESAAPASARLLPEALMPPGGPEWSLAGGLDGARYGMCMCPTAQLLVLERKLRQYVRALRMALRIARMQLAARGGPLSPDFLELAAPFDPIDPWTGQPWAWFVGPASTHVVLTVGGPFRLSPIVIH